MSEPPPEDNWALAPRGVVAGQFKWGWNEASGAVVWPVAGPGDGFPSHDAFLSSAWGRAPSSSAGDRLGRAHCVAANEVEAASALVVVESYYDAELSWSGSDVSSRTPSWALQWVEVEGGRGAPGPLVAGRLECPISDFLPLIGRA